MEHSESKTAVLTDNEPPDGTVLILHEGGNDWRAIVRLDQIAAMSNQEDHWYDAEDQTADPLTLHGWLKYADAVYALGEKLAEF